LNAETYMRSVLLGLTVLPSVLLPVLAAGGQAVSSDDMRRLLLNRVTDVVLIDVRAPGDYAAGHFQGALIPFRPTKPGTEPPRQTALREPTGPPPPTHELPGIATGT